MSFLYIPNINDDLFLDTNDILLGDYRLIKLLNYIYELDKKYKIEKIISFNDKSYQKEIEEIIKHPIELYNREINSDTGYFHITFEKKLQDDVIYPKDTYCEYAISLIIKDNIYEKESFMKEFLSKKKMNNAYIKYKEMVKYKYKYISIY